MCFGLIMIVICCSSSGTLFVIVIIMSSSIATTITAMLIETMQQHPLPIIILAGLVIIPTGPEYKHSYGVQTPQRNNEGAVG